MLALNDVQQLIIQDLREGGNADLPLTEDETAELEYMALVCEDSEIGEEIRSILEHMDE